MAWSKATVGMKTSHGHTPVACGVSHALESARRLIFDRRDSTFWAKRAQDRFIVCLFERPRVSGNRQTWPGCSSTFRGGRHGSLHRGTSTMMLVLRPRGTGRRGLCDDNEEDSLWLGSSDRSNFHAEKHEGACAAILRNCGCNPDTLLMCMVCVAYL